MPGIRFAVAGIALGSALLFHPTHATPPPLPTVPTVPTPVAPPAEFAAYIAQVRLADALQDGEARCNAHPDLPGNQWRPGAAQGRCSVLRAPAFTLDQLDALLANDDGVAELDRRFSALLDAHYRDQAQREQIFKAFSVFDESARAGEVAERWLKAAPKSAFAMVALGIHHGSAGWVARGGKYASKTSQEQFQSMTGHFAKAVPLYLQALEVEPRLSVACYKLNGIGRQSSDALQTFAMSHCLKVDPDSYNIAWEQIVSAQPKWGGSDAKMRSAVAYAAARTERNPILGALLGEAAGYAPSMADTYGEVADELAGAARMGPSGSLMGDAGSGYWTRGDYWKSVVFYSQALRFWPHEARFRYARAALMAGRLNDPAWARSDLKIALQHAPDNARYLFLMGTVTQTLETPAAARPFFERAMKDEWRQQAMEHYCQTYMMPTITAEARDCTRRLVEEFPKSTVGWHMRAWALADDDVDAALAAAQQFRTLADPKNPDQTRAFEHLKALETELQSKRPASAAGAAGK